MSEQRTDTYRITELEQAVYDLRVTLQSARDAVAMLSGELADAWTRIAELAQQLHDHEQATPHPEAAS